MLRAYALNKAWLIGFLMDIFGALLMLRALSLAPVSSLAPRFRFFVIVGFSCALKESMFIGPEI